MVNSREVNPKLKETSDKFFLFIELAIKVSKLIHGRPVHIKLSLGSALLIRMCTISESIYKLVPYNKLSQAKRENWDSSSIMALCRNLVECYHTFFYVCVDPVSDDEWTCRRLILNLHDCLERMKIFDHFGRPDDRFAAQAQELKNDLAANVFFQNRDPKFQKHLLKGEKAFMISHDETETRLDNRVPAFKGLYKFLSQHVHTTPMSFYRMGEQDRGRGVENDADKGYIIFTLEVATGYLQQTVRDILNLFPDLTGILSRQELEFISEENKIDETMFQDPQVAKALIDIAVKTFEWEVQPFEQGVLLTLEVGFQVPEAMEYMSLMVAKKQDIRRPAGMSIVLPSNINKERGAQLNFLNRKSVEVGPSQELENKETIKLALLRSDEESIAARTHNGFITDELIGREIDLFDLFMSRDHIHFTFFHFSGKEIRLMIPLYSFKEAYGKL